VITWSLTAALITLLRADDPWVNDVASVMLPVMGVAGLLVPLVWLASIASVSF
jgi:hypothetical protein